MVKPPASTMKACQGRATLAGQALRRTSPSPTAAATAIGTQARAWKTPAALAQPRAAA